MNPDRREFLLRAGGVAAGAVLFPGSSLARNAPRLRPDTRGQILVLLQLSGGNDGLSTVVPHANDRYHRARKATRIDPNGVLRLDDAVGLHPNLKGLHAAFQAGRLAIVQGAGYPRPNRSHFESMDIWHAASPSGRSAGAGWIGRFADQLDDADANVVIHVGAQIPYALHARRRQPIGFTTPDAYRWQGSPEEASTLAMASSRPGAHAGRDRALDRIRATLLEAQRSSAAVRDAAAKYRAKVAYPSSGLARSLHSVAALVAGGLSTRVFSVEFGGFDTHVNQKGSHDNLMAQLDGALTAFQADLDAQKLSDRVLVLAFSEFGRRLAENGSGGTDHGVAGPMFALCAKVKGGLYGAHPSLDDLDRGDLRHTIDFRCAYATVLDRWLSSDHAAILGETFEPVPFLPA